MVQATDIRQAIETFVKINYGQSELDNPSWNIPGLTNAIAEACEVDKLSGRDAVIYDEESDTYTCGMCDEDGFECYDGVIEKDIGFLCDSCLRSLKSRGETITIIESS